MSDEFPSPPPTPEPNKKSCSLPLPSSGAAFTGRKYSAVIILYNSPKIRSAIKLLCNIIYNPTQKIVITTNKNQWFLVSTYSFARKDFISCLTFLDPAVSLSSVHEQVEGVFSCEGLSELFSKEDANFVKIIISNNGTTMHVSPTVDGLDLGMFPPQEWSLTKPEIDLSIIFEDREMITTEPMDYEGFLRQVETARPRIPDVPQAPLPQFSFVCTCTMRNYESRLMTKIPCLSKGDVKWKMDWYDLDALIEATSIGYSGPAAGIVAKKFSSLVFGETDMNLSFLTDAEDILEIKSNQTSPTLSN